MESNAALWHTDYSISGRRTGLKGGRATSSSSKLLAEGTAARSTGNNSETHEGRPKARRVATKCWLAHSYRTSPVAVLLDGAVVHTTDDAEEAILTPVRAPAVPHCTPIAQHTTGAGHTHNRLTRRAQDRHAHTHTLALCTGPHQSSTWCPRGHHLQAARWTHPSPQWTRCGQCCWRRSCRTGCRPCCTQVHDDDDDDNVKGNNSM